MKGAIGLAIYCHVCSKKGGSSSIRVLKQLAELGWALVTQGYSANQCPACNRKEDAEYFGKLPEWVTIKRLPGFDHYDVTIRVEHADAKMAKKLLAAIRKIQR